MYCLNVYYLYCTWGKLRICKTQCLTPRSLWPGHTRPSLYLDLLGSKPLIFIHTFSWAPRWSFSSSISWPLCISKSELLNLHSQIHFSSSHYSVKVIEAGNLGHIFNSSSPCPSSFSPMQSTTGFPIFWNSLQMHPLLSILTVTSLVEVDMVIHLDH